jgi:hypothetical protein
MIVGNVSHLAEFPIFVHPRPGLQTSRALYYYYYLLLISITKDLHVAACRHLRALTCRLCAWESKGSPSIFDYITLEP